MDHSTKLSLLGLACCVALGAAERPGRVLHVDAAAARPGDGASWASAYADLDSALAASVNGDQIWVAEGTYKPAGRDRTATFALVDGVALYGGFAGHETRLDERDWLRHPTTLSGDRAGDDGTEPSSTGENCYHVLTGRNVGPTTLLDGFTVTGGRADGPGLGPVPESQDQGSALNLYSATPRVEHIIFTRNWSSGHGTVNDNAGATFVACEFRSNFAIDFAGALFVSADAATLVADCSFLDNTAIGKGGGIYCQSSSGSQISNCFFSGNAATAGGGFFGADGSHASIRASTFLANTAAIGGGGVYDDGASPRVIGCTFDGNAAGVDVKSGGGGAGGSGGGGLWNSGGEAWVQGCQFRNNAASFGGGAYNNNASLATFRDCTFEHNTAHEAGGIYNLGSDVVIEHCAFIRNDAADGDFSVGGGVSNYYSNTKIANCSFRANHAAVGGGGVYNEGAAPTLVGCIFAQNFADGITQGWGGGVFNGYFCAPTLCNCTFVGNTAHRGGGIFDFIFSAATIVNCTLSGNVSPEGSGLFDFDGSSTRLENSIVWGNGAPFEMSGTTVRAEYCCIQGGYPGVGISAADPLFRGTPDPGPDGKWGTDDDHCGDLRLLTGSPCIDAGDNHFVPPNIVDDVLGNPRFVDDPSTPDTGPSASPVVDLGAFER